MEFSQKKILFFFTYFYPFEITEPYIEPEFDYLVKYFDEIIIYSSSEKTTLSYILPENVKAVNTPVKIDIISKIFAFRFIFNKIFWKEIKFLKKNKHKKISFDIIIILLREIQKGYFLRNFVLKEYKKNILLGNQIFHYSFWNDYKAFSGVLLKNKFPQIKVFSRAHGWDVYPERNYKNYLPLKSVKAEKMDSIYFVSNYGCNYYSNKIGNYKSLKISYLGIKKNEPVLYPVHKKPFHIFICCSFVKIKRMDLFIYAISHINPEFKIHFTHIGFGGDLKEYIFNLVKTKLSHKENISYVFKGGYSNTEVLNFYKKEKPNLLVSVSSTEGLPMSMMEAMSFGIPVLGTDVGGTSEIIEHKNNGLLIDESSSPLEIAKAIEFFYSMELNEYNKYCSNAYQTWENKFNAEKNYTKFIDEIGNL